MTHTWSSPSNIALVKYWGKHGQQLPSNPSISFTLSNCRSTTSMTLKEGKGFTVALDGVDKPAFAAKIQTWFELYDENLTLAAAPRILPGGEAVKTGWDHVHTVTGLLNDHALDRHSFVLAVGGGAFLDMVGFAAAIFHRGVKLIRIPTTTLSQNDAGIGVKNGINQHGQKNCLGTFSPPFAVINDIGFLNTLSFDHFIGGVAEAFKISLIRDQALFNYLEKNAHKLRSRDLKCIQKVIEICALLHLDHIAKSGDPFETGSSRPLDYGHWSAHKIEILSNHTLSHGQAVSIGIALDSYYAFKRSLISEADFKRLLNAMVNCGLPVWSQYLEMEDSTGKLEIETGLEEFRKHLGGRLTFTMPKGIGAVTECHEMDFDSIRQGISFLKKYGKANSLPDCPN